VKRALIIGVTGQTGAYLAHHLLAHGYHVVGGSRDADSANLARLRTLGIADDVKLVSLAPADFGSQCPLSTGRGEG
jgi:GDPmannose 4,6-dehydratase